MIRRSLWWHVKDYTKAGLIILLFSTPILLSAFSVWFVASGVTSLVKTFSDDCGQRYPIEFILGGDWFCPEKEK